MSDQDTIIAPATPVTNSGVAVIRISGARAVLFLHEHFCSVGRRREKFTSHRFYYGYIVDKSGSTIDESMVVYMESPKTYTCESVVEIHCHGSRYIVRQILDLAYAFGIRSARPGEFTYRAYMNGRIDLPQAEAVARLIQSTSAKSHKAALQQLGGLLSRTITSFSLTVRNALAEIEAWIDFPDEDLPEENLQNIVISIRSISDRMNDLLRTYRAGRYIHNGATIALAGCPNVGKSSLMNALLQEDRSIVSDIPGTTRDYIESHVVFGGMAVRLVDTAGIRTSVDRVEQEGVRRSQGIIESSDLVLLLCDKDSVNNPDFFELLASCNDNNTFLVLTKSDLKGGRVHSSHFFDGKVLSVSSRTGCGIDNLKNEVVDYLLKDYSSSSETALLTESRHFVALSSAQQFLSDFMAHVGFLPLDILSIDLRGALDSLGELTGAVTREDVLSDIFSRFCIGK